MITRTLALSALILTAINFSAINAQAKTNLVACVGDSITEQNKYVSNLQNLLNATYALSGYRTDVYTVTNFGNSGKTAIDLDASYMKTQTYTNALNSNPDIVIILLGTNDSRRGTTYDNIARFVGDYTRLAQSFLDLPSHPKVYLADPSTMPNEGTFDDNDINLVAGVIPRIHVVSRNLDLPSIDVHTPTFGHPEWVFDNVHPDAATAGKCMAAAMYEALTGLQSPATMYPSVWHVPTTNLLVNGSMEIGLTGWAATGGGTLAVNNSFSHSGSNSLQLNRTSTSQGIAQDIKAALLASGPGDYFFEAWVRLASIYSNSPTATLTITINDSTGNHTFTTGSSAVNRTTWTDLRSIQTITWSGTLNSATLSVTGAAVTDPLLLDEVFLQKYPYVVPTGRANGPTYLVATNGAGSTIVLGWTDNANNWPAAGTTSNETAYLLEWATDRNLTQNTGSTTVAANTTSNTIAVLNPGTTYYFRVSGTNDMGATGYSNLAAATTAGTPVGPAAPTNLSFAATNDAVQLAWTDNASNENGYRVEWASDPDFVRYYGSMDLPANSTNYTVTGLFSSSSYSFRVRAVGSAGDSAPSPVVQCATWWATPNGTAANVVIASTSSTSASLTWADDCTNESGWDVDYATDAAFTQNFGSMNVGANATSATVTGLLAGNNYYFRIRGFKTRPGGYGDVILNPVIVYGPYAPQAPNAPNNLAAWVYSSSQVNLSWADNSPTEDGFKMDRATDSGFTANLTTTNLAANATTCNATGLNANTTYYFRVRAYNTIGESANSSAVSVTTPNAGTPNTPSALTATTASSSLVNLGWTDNSTDETSFKIERATDSAFTQNAATNTVSANTTNYSATGLSPNTTYYFRVRATNGAGDSVNSASASATTLPLPPAAPSSLTISSATEAQVALTWTDNSSNEDGFRIDRALDAGFTSNLVTVTVGTDVITGAFSSLNANTTYYFRVRAYNIGGESANSGVVSTNTPAPTIPAAPNGLTGTAVSESQINLAWIDNSFNETSFSLDRALNSGFSSGLTTTVVAANSSAFNVTGLAAATVYYFRVRAANAAGESTNSNVTGVTTFSNVLAANDPFAGTTNTTLNTQSGGSGWSANWVSDIAAYTNTAGSLAYTDSLGAALIISGNRVRLNSTASYKQATRNSGIFTNKMNGGQPLDIWFSCLMKPVAGDMDFNPWSNDPYNAGTVAQGNNGTITYFNNAWTGGTEVGKTAPNLTLKTNQVNLIVCRYEVPADKHAFTWTWYVNPTNLTDVINSSTKTVWTATNTTGTLKGLTGFGIRNRVASLTTIELDELRYGDSVALVTPYLATPAAPTGLGATAVSPSEIDLTWIDTADNETGYKIDRATDSNFTQNFATLTVAANSTNYNATGLAAGTLYYFRVRATNAAGDSSNTIWAVATTFAAGNVDSVGDGIPDAWRQANFSGDSKTTNSLSCATCDPDGDGQNNASEYRAGTNPNNPADVFELRIYPINGGVIVEFDGLAAAGAGYTSLERRYDLELNTSLTGGSWVVSATCSNVLGQDQIISYTNSSANPATFYRGRVRMQ